MSPKLKPEMGRQRSLSLPVQDAQGSRRVCLLPRLCGMECEVDSETVHHHAILFLPSIRIPSPHTCVPAQGHRRGRRRRWELGTHAIIVGGTGSSSSGARRFCSRRTIGPPPRGRERLRARKATRPLPAGHHSRSLLCVGAAAGRVSSFSRNTLPSAPPPIECPRCHDRFNPKR